MYIYIYNHINIIYIYIYVCEKIRTKHGSGLLLFPRFIRRFCWRWYKRCHAIARALDLGSVGNWRENCLVQTMLQPCAGSWPIGSMVLVYMLTWLGYIDGIHVTIYIAYMDPMGDGILPCSWSFACWPPKSCFPLGFPPIIWRSMRMC